MSSSNRIAELQRKPTLTEGERMELEHLLSRKVYDKQDIRKGGLQDDPNGDRGKGDGSGSGGPW